MSAHHQPLKREPWAHQQRAIDVAEARFAAGETGILFDMAMGVGKGLVACALFRDLPGKVLVLCPKNVVGVWRREVPANIEGWEVSCIEGSSTAVRRKRLKQALLHNDQRVIVTNIESLRADMIFQDLLDVDWAMLIVDESHRIKSPSGLDSKRVRAVSKHARLKLCLTGTPMPHSPLDIWAQAEVCAPGVFHQSWFAFQKFYERRKEIITNRGQPNQKAVKIHDEWMNLDDHHRRLRKFVHSCTRDDAKLSLPPCTHQVVPVALEGRQAKLYKQMDEDYIMTLGASIDDGDLVISPNVLSKMLRLQQATSGAVGGGDDLNPTEVEVIGTAKMDVLASILEKVKDSKSGPVVVFCRFTHSIACVKAAAAELKMSCGELSGADRSGLTDTSTLAEFDVTAVQYQSGGVGVDFTRSAHVICFDQLYDLGMFDQAMARCDRPGQERPVLVQHLVAEIGGKETIDGDMRTVVNERRDFITELLAGKIRKVHRSDYVKGSP